MKCHNFAEYFGAENNRKQNGGRNALKVDRNANQSHLCSQKVILTAALHTDTRVSMKQDMDSIRIQNS